MTAEATGAAPPKPAFTLEISILACDWDRIVQELERSVRHVVERGPECVRFWGGAGTHGHVHVERRDVTQEQYNAELQEWFTATREVSDDR